MEALRWILIAAGVVFIVAIYVLGKKRRDRESSLLDVHDLDVSDVETNIDTDLDMGLPEFSANSLDDVDEGVGTVRVISGGDPYEETTDDNYNLNQNQNHSSEDSSVFGANDAFGDTAANEQKNKKANDIIVIYILPKGGNVLNGSQINSAAQALGLSFGEMNIFHYIREGESVFSLANMLEPGSFNIETIGHLKTSGLTIFMQIKGDDPMDDLTEMLQRSYQLAGLLEARLCNHKREPLTEQDAENYRSQIRDLI